MKTLIVVLNWNSREMTEQCIHSLLAMEGDSFSITAVDNGSRDGSVEYLRSRFPQIRVIAISRNVGFAAGCNIGIRQGLTDGVDYVLLVNNDTIVDPSLLRELLAEAQRTHKAGIVSPKIYYFDRADSIWWVGGTYSLRTGLAKHIDLKHKDTGKYDVPRDLDWATGCVMMLSSEALRAAGMFDEQFFGNGEDLDLSLRMRKLGYVVRYAPMANVWHREGVDYQKNVGEHVRSFTLVRNLLWVMHKHARMHHWLTFWPIFAGYYLPKMALRFALRGDLRSCWAMLHGVTAFWEMLLHPERSVLPAALRTATQPASNTESEQPLV